MSTENRRVDSTRAAASGNNNNMIIEQIMLRFRPIAPRPETAQNSGGFSPEKEFKRTRVKRKYVRVKKTKKMNKKNNNITSFDLDRTVAMIEDSTGGEVEVKVTDPLQNVSNWISFDCSGSKRKGKVMNNDNRTDNNSLFVCETPEKYSPDLHGVDLATAVQRRSVVESWITMESVTGTCEDRRLLGCTDDEIWKNLETDSCPGFISSGYGHGQDEVVQWVNPAYRSMLDLDSDGETPLTEVAVWLKAKVEKSTVEKYLPAFSCRVRIEYRSEKKKTRMTVPCDVFLMDSGGFAWRLDVKFALSLGLSN
ncbi:hypothetical protein HanPI659440_Chr07g0273111 [Helianthus annuus]|nr:hypothetical protein HanPI659440_Chr07g0273111 [Helianthus annuus]